MFEPDQPLTELVERAWKMLYRHGESYRDQRYNDLRRFYLDDWIIRSTNRFLWIERLTATSVRVGGWGRSGGKQVLTVDEEGMIGDIDVVECANALEAFRQATILDDLADL